MVSFGPRLKELRQAKHISQRDLAEKVGVDFSYISKVENDRIPPPSADTIVRICEALQVPPGELLSLTGKLPSEMKQKLGASSAAIEFITEAQQMRLTDEEWDRLTRGLKRLRGR